MIFGQSIGLIVIILSMYILWQIREVLLLIFAAVVLATTLNRLARQFQRLGLKRGLAIILSVLVFIALIVGFFWLIVPPFAAQSQELTYRVPKGLERLNGWLDQLEARIPSQLAPYVPDINSLSKQAQPLINRAVGTSFAFFSSSLEVFLKILLVLVWTGMLLTDPQSYRQVFIRLFPSFYRRRVDGILNQCEVSLEGWITGALIAMGFVGTMSLVGLSVLQVQSALALGVLAGFMNLIPNVGPTISVIPAMAIALLDAPWKSLAVFALYFVIQQTEGNLVTPVVMAHQVSLLPAISLIAQLFFFTFFGFLGLLLALPLTVVAKIWLQEVLIKDVLDQWDNHSKIQNELIVVSESQPESVDNSAIGEQETTDDVVVRNND
ncbi:MAG: AI-2E family transporter [Rhizonema sp. PD37]|nr:AI-2E family transporter [Rhizonema sp. PD37]